MIPCTELNFCPGINSQRVELCLVSGFARKLPIFGLGRFVVIHNILIEVDLPRVERVKN
jgi:hypothetical protein